MNDAEVLKALAALAHASRLKVFRLLVVAGTDGGTPSQITEELGLPGSSLSFHLKELTNSGLVDQERVGRHLVYRARMDAMNDLMAFLTANCCGGQACMPDLAVDCSNC